MEKLTRSVWDVAELARNDPGEKERWYREGTGRDIDTQ